MSRSVRLPRQLAPPVLAVLAIEPVAVAAVLVRPWIGGRLIDAGLADAAWPVLAACAAALAGSWLVRAVLMRWRDGLIGRLAVRCTGLADGRAVLAAAAGDGGRGDAAARVGELAPRLLADAWSALLRMALGAALLVLLHPDLLLAVLPAAGVCLVLAWSARRASAAGATELAMARRSEAALWERIEAGRQGWNPLGWEVAATEDAIAAARIRIGRERRLAAASGWGQPGMSLAMAVGVAFAVMAGAQHLRAGTISLGDLASGVFLVILTVGPVMDLAATADRWPVLAAAWRRLRTGIPAPAGPAPGTSLAWAGLVVDLPDGRRLRLPDGGLAAGSRLLVHGPSGSGKSTLLRCLAGRQRPDGGRVSAPVAPVLLAHDQPLPPCTVAELLAAAGGLPADPAAIRRQACRLGLDAAIASTPGGYDARADAVTGTAAGQAVAAVAVSFGTAPLLLDESFSSLPPETGLAVAEALAATGRGVAWATHQGIGRPEWPGLRLGA